MQDKKQYFQSKLLVKEFLVQKLDFIFQILNDLESLSLVYEIEYLCQITDDLKPYLLHEISTLRTIPQKDYYLLIRNFDDESIHDDVYKAYPSKSTFRYLPTLNYLSIDECELNKKLNSILAANKIDNQQVFLFYNRYPTVLRMDLFSVVKHLEVFRPENRLSEDLCIVSIDFEWLVLLSVEDELFFIQRDLKSKT
jgi:hypothetical protein